MNTKIYKLSFLFCVSLLITSCTKFTELNTNPYGVSNEQLEGDARIASEPFRQIQSGIHVATPTWVAQLQTNLSVDVFSGYMAPPTPFRNNSNNITYNLVDGWNSFISSTLDQRVLAPGYQVSKVLDADPAKYGLFSEWLKILKVMAVHRVSDVQGPVIYSNYGEKSTYDSQEEAYNKFFEDLESAVKILYNTTETRNLFSSDLSYASDYKAWAKLANSLRLRLAIRIVKIDPVKAKLEAEKSLSSPVGLIKLNTENYNVDLGSVNNPLNVFTGEWNDIRMNAAIQSYMVGYKDPRLSVYFMPTKSLVVNKNTNDISLYVGIRQGIPIDAKPTYQDISSSIAKMPSKVQLMNAAEVYFLLAEAKLRGWNLGTHDAAVEVLYNKGIETSFEQYSKSQSFNAYITSTDKPIAYTDPVNINAMPANAPVPNNNSVAPTNAGVQFVTGSNEEQLEQIIIQKWIAIFPNGNEAWAEFRRTGYPKMFPLNDSWKKGNGTKVPSGEYIKRINFNVNERTANPTGYAEAVKKLGGADDLNTRVWWDVNKANF